MVDCVTVMAGGIGSRLWPASTARSPKQLLPLGSDGVSLLQRTVERALKLQAPRILIIAPQQQQELLINHCSQFAEECRRRISIIIEPEGRNTAPALSIASGWVVNNVGPEAIQLVLAADHLIASDQQFARDVAKAVELATNSLVVFAVPPIFPETGFGYIIRGAARPPGFEVQGFVEKPDLNRAMTLLQRGDCYWNSGIFCYQTALMATETSKYQPQFAPLLNFAGWRASSAKTMKVYFATEELANLYQEVDKISIDYAVMEHSQRMAMVEAGFDWSDIGSWDAMATADDDGQLSIEHNGQIIAIQSNNNYVKAQQPVALCGVSDLIVVEANGYLLICKKGDSQLVKEIDFSN